VRALALRAWPTLAAANEGIRSGCFRLQADATLPTFLRSIPPQEDTF